MMPEKYNINIGGIDPLLGGTGLAAQLRELEAKQRMLEEHKKNMSQLYAQVDQGTSPQVSQTPIWDEVDTITGNMSEAEFAEMQANPDYQQSLKELMTFVGAMQLQAIRPMVEQSKEGKAILEQHLATVKVIRKSATAKVDMQLTLFKEYTEKYSNMTYDEFLKTKGGK
jgi:DNA-binding FrmR family transcriptional regulator